MLVILSECLKKQTEFAVIKSARHAASFHMHLVFTCFATAKEKKKQLTTCGTVACIVLFLAQTKPSNLNLSETQVKQQFKFSLLQCQTSCL